MVHQDQQVQQDILLAAVVAAVIMEEEFQEDQVVLVVEVQDLIHLVVGETLAQLILVVAAVAEIVVMPQVDQVELVALE
jgi:hypothetical protein